MICVASAMQLRPRTRRYVQALPKLTRKAHAWYSLEDSRADSMYCRLGSNEEDGNLECFGHWSERARRGSR